MGWLALFRHGAPTQAAQISTPWQWWWCPSLPVGPPPAMAGRPGRGKPCTVWCRASPGPRVYIPYLDSTAMLPHERVFRHERGATHAPLRVDDCQFALGFESANLSKNRRPQRQESALRLLRNSGITGLPSRRRCKCEPARLLVDAARFEAMRRVLTERAEGRSDAIGRLPHRRCKYEPARLPVDAARFEAMRRVLTERAEGRSDAIGRPLRKR
jgi:hypothetical protein